MPSSTADAAVRLPMMRQRWRSAAFVHWEYPPDALGGLIPAPFELESHEGRAWVGLTPFTTDLKVFGVARLPGPRRFCETNLRTYVRAPDGSDGVWFLSLDVTNAANVPLGRLGFPYNFARLRVDRFGRTVRYAGSRVGGRRPAYDIEMQCCPAEIPVHDDLDVFLTGRWHTYTKRGPFLGRFDIEHAPWPLHRAELIRGNEDVLQAAGLPPPLGPPVLHYSPGVDVSISLPTLI